MFFGKCFDQSRPWSPVFHFKSDPEYAHHVFRQFASEYFGDSRVSSQLFAAYKECLNQFSEQTVYRSGMGAMGRGQLEKMLLAEVVLLFLGDGCLSHDNEQNFERKLQPGAIAALENQLKTKLDRKQVDQETRINSEDDTTNCYLMELCTFIIA